MVADVKEELIEVLQEDVITPVKPRDEGDHSYKLSAVALAVMVFYKVSGGPFGCEPTVKAAGPFYALLGFILFPILWSIPEAFITAELGSAYPEPSGRTFFFHMFLFLFLFWFISVMSPHSLFISTWIVLILPLHSLPLFLLYFSGSMGRRSIWIQGIIVMWILSLDLGCDGQRDLSVIILKILCLLHTL
jgi:hypothetical protein